MRDKIKGLDTKWLYLLLINFIAAMVMYQGFLQVHLSIDSPDTIVASHQAATWHFNSGRFFYTLVVFFVDWLGLNIVYDSWLWTTLFSIVNSVAVTLFTKLCYDELGKTVSNNEEINLMWLLITLNCAFWIGFNNIFTTEWLYFAEVELNFICATIGAVFALWFTIKNGSIRNYAIAFIFLVMMWNSYQPAFGIFFFLLMIVSLLKDGFIVSKRMVKKLSILFGEMMIVVSSNLALVKYYTKVGKILPGSRYSTLNANNFFQSIKGVLKYQKVILLEGNGMTKGPWIAVVGGILVIVAVVWSIKLKRLKSFAVTIIAIAVCEGAVFAPNMVNKIFSGASPRAIEPYFFAFTFLLVYILHLLICPHEASLRMTRAVITISVAFFITATIISANIYQNDVLITNRMDEMWIMSINSRICNYEAETGIEVKYLLFEGDDHSQFRWPSVHFNYKADVCAKMLMADWSREAYIYILTGRHYKVVKPTYSSFAGMDFDSLDIEKQMIFEGDTCHICIY